MIKDAWGANPLTETVAGPGVFQRANIQTLSGDAFKLLR